MRKRINNDFDALVNVVHEGVKIDLSLYEITSVRMVSNQVYQVPDYEIRNGSLFLHVTPLIAPKPGKYKIVVTYRKADPTLADGYWNFEFDKYLVTIVSCSEDEDAGEVVITADAVIGMRGKSAYQVWLDAGNEGTVEDYLADIKGEQGADGAGLNYLGTVATSSNLNPSYQGLANDAFVTEDLGRAWKWTGTQWLDVGSFRGEKGDTGEQGEQGIQGEKGEKGEKGEQGEQGIQGIQGVKGDTGNGIQSITLTSTVGKVKTYTITFTDLTTTTFTVTDGEDGHSSEIGGESITSVTYSEMTALIASSELKVGAKYIITDYQTVHEIPFSGIVDFENEVMLPNEINTGQIEPLLVTAISVNELAPEAYSALFPDDIIYYSPTNDQDMVPGCTKGCIYRRIDTKQNNDIPFDFRQVKFRRWQISQPTWSASETYAKGAVVKSTTDDTLWMSLQDNNLNIPLISDATYWRHFEWDNLSYTSPFPNLYYVLSEPLLMLTCTELYQDYKMWANDADYTSAYSNKIEAPSSNLIENTNTVIFGGDFCNNSIGHSFMGNSIGAGFGDNSIAFGFSSNSIEGGFSYNSIGAGFYGNSIGDSFTNNSIGADFSSNSIGAGFSYNSIGAMFNNNSIGAGFWGNSASANISKGLSAVTELYNKYYPHELIATNGFGVLIRWYDSSGVQKTQVIP